jgi:cell wall-associated NlpC family hydrolase
MKRLIEFILSLFKKKQTVLNEPTHITNIPVKPSPEPESKYLELNPGEQARLVEIAEKCLGIPYKLGAEVLNLDIEPDKIKEIDCSEATEYWYHKIGYKIRDGSFNQYDDSEEVNGQVKIGDCGYRRSFETGKISHVFMYIGNDYIIEANGLSKYRKVVKRKLEEATKDSQISEYIGMRRFLKSKARKLQ